MPRTPTKTTQEREEATLDMIRANGGIITLEDLLSLKSTKYVRVQKKVVSTKWEWVRKEAYLTRKQARYTLEKLREKGKIQYPFKGNKIKLV
jgi:hypothetical protein